MSGGYEPTARRPIAGVFRATAHAATRLCLRLGIGADAISYLSMVAATAAAICFWKSARLPWLLLIAPLFCYLRLWFNMLDGMVAVAGGSASLRGEILNDLPDRVSDVIIFAGLAHSGLVHSAVAYWAAISAVLTAYVGLFGQALGGGREFAGLMSKPWRMVALGVGAWLTFACRSCADATLRLTSLSLLDWTCLVIIVGCAQTIFVRLKGISAALENKRG